MTYSCKKYLIVLTIILFSGTANAMQEEKKTIRKAQSRR